MGQDLHHGHFYNVDRRYFGRFFFVWLLQLLSRGPQGCQDVPQPIQRTTTTTTKSSHDALAPGLVGSGMTSHDGSNAIALFRLSHWVG